MQNKLILLLSILLTACGNPGEISDEDYAKYKELGAPKILYTCNRGETLGVDIDALQVCLKIKDDAAKSLACVNAAEREKKPIIDVGYTAGIGMNATYNKILADAKRACSGTFKVLDSKS